MVAADRTAEATAEAEGKISPLTRARSGRQAPPLPAVFVLFAALEAAWRIDQRKKSRNC